MLAIILSVCEDLLYFCMQHNLVSRDDVQMIYGKILKD